MSDCLFCKIAREELPCRKVYEDDEVLAFHDIHPVAPVHFMLIPKLHMASLADAEESHQGLLGRMLLLDQYRAWRRAGNLSSAYARHRRRQHTAYGTSGLMRRISWVR
jgi:galactose-1-phosphate uridylyltransferase